MKDAAHINSLGGFLWNGYFPQLDSKDDQFSITRGIRMAERHDLMNKEWDRKNKKMFKSRPVKPIFFDNNEIKTSDWLIP